MTGITTCSWSSTTWPTTVGPRNCLCFVTFLFTMPAAALSQYVDYRDETVNILKKGSCNMSLHTQKLVFLGVCNYLPASGFSYDKYLRTYGGLACQWGIFFLSLWICRRSGLATWYLATLCGLLFLTAWENTREEGLRCAHGQRNYAELCWLWVCKGMTSLRDLLVHFNVCNVVPALQKQCNIYKEVKLDMLKDCPSLPSIGMHYGMSGSEGLFHMFGQEQADLVELMNAAIINFPSCSNDTWRSASPPSGHLTMVLSCFLVVPWLALMQIRCTHGPAQDITIQLAMSGVSRTMAWMLRPCTTTIERGTAGLSSNGWPMRQKSAGWRACCMQAMSPRCDWTCATYPWMAIIWTLPRCSSSIVACFTVMCVTSSRTPGSTLLLGRGRSAMKRTKTTWGSLVPKHSWPSGSASGSPSSWPQQGSGHQWMGGYCRRQHPRVSNAQFASASPWGWYAGASAGNTRGPHLRPGPGGYPYTRGVEGQVPWLPPTFKSVVLSKEDEVQAGHCEAGVRHQRPTRRRLCHCHSSGSSGSSSGCSGSSGVTATTPWPPLQRGSTVIAVPGPIFVV